MSITSLTVMGDSGTEYTIAVDGNGSATCTCPSFQYRTKWCKHLAFVFDHLKMLKAVG